MLELAKAADQVAEGNYDVDIPGVPAKDEIGHLAERFRQMASRLAEAEKQERNFLMSVSHELRTPLTAIRGHVDALREGLIDEEERGRPSLDVIATRPTGSSGSSATCSTSPSSTRTGSRCCARRSTWAR